MGERAEVRTIAHRGASFDAPENTAASFDLAIEVGSWALELDIQQTSDGELVVWHDDDLDRTARVGGSPLSGAIHEQPFEAIALCDAGSWFNEAHPGRASDDYVGQCPLTLNDVLRRYGQRLPLFLELKKAHRRPGMWNSLVEALDRHPLPAEPHRIMSTDAATLVAIHCSRPEIPLVQVLPSRGHWHLRLEEIARYADAISPLRTSVGPQLIRAAQSVGLEVYPHTVNSPADMKRFEALGVDGLITDAPGRAVELLRRSEDPGARADAVV